MKNAQKDGTYQVFQKDGKYVVVTNSSDEMFIITDKDLNEAKDYYAHPVLGARLLEITKELLNIESDDPMNAFGSPDAFKVRSCMTLFKHAAPQQELFQKVLDKFCRGIEDDKTLRILNQGM